jgi:hypothetical protein
MKNAFVKFGNQVVSFWTLLDLIHRNHLPLIDGEYQITNEMIAEMVTRDARDRTGPPKNWDGVCLVQGRAIP